MEFNRNIASGKDLITNDIFLMFRLVISRDALMKFGAQRQERSNGFPPHYPEVHIASPLWQQMVKQVQY